MNIIRCVFIFITLCLSSLYANSRGNILSEIDLTWPFDENAIYWTNNSAFSFRNRISGTDLYGYWYANNDFCVGEHTGTYFSAPYNLNENGWTVGEVPLFKLIANGVTIDLSEETEKLKETTRLLPKHILQWERKHGPIPGNSVILVRFGWSQYYSNRSHYLGFDENNIHHFPGISKEAAELIVDLETVVGVGVDTASVEPAAVQGLLSHKVLNKHQIYILKNVNIPADLPETDYKLYVMPMKIQEGTGAPLRLIAQLNHHWKRVSNSNLLCSNLLLIFVGLILSLFKK